jgi:hypothetical protein
MGNLQINVNGKINKPIVSNNSAKLDNQIFTFDIFSFTKDWQDPQGGSPHQVNLESLTDILELKFNSNTAVEGIVFLTGDSSLLSFNLNPKYAIYNGHLYEYSKDIDLIISDYDALGLKLISNINGLLTFIDPNNLSDVRKVQGTELYESNASFTFTTSSNVSNLKSNIATFTLEPSGNVNIKDNFILTGANSGIDNPVTGHSIIVDPNDSTQKISSITLQDGTTITTTFTDNDSIVSVNVVDANTRATRVKIAEIDGTNLYETLTALITPTLEGSVLTLKYRNENDIIQTVQVDLSNIVPSYDINIDSATYSAANNIITLTETNGDVYNIDLSEFSIQSNILYDGTIQVIQEGEVKFTFHDDSKVRVIQVPTAELSTIDKAGVIEYLNNQGLTKLNIETIIIELVGDITIVTVWVDADVWDDSLTWTE